MTTVTHSIVLKIPGNWDICDKSFTIPTSGTRKDLLKFLIVDSSNIYLTVNLDTNHKHAKEKFDKKFYFKNSCYSLHPKLNNCA